MVFTESQLVVFQELYLQYYGERLSVEEAEQAADKLLEMLLMVYRPLTSEEHQRYGFKIYN